MSDQPRILATVDARCGYDGMIVAVRARVAEIGLNSRLIDELSGLTPGYTGKLLGDAQIRQFGLDALLAISATLGLCFDVRVDPHQETLMRPHWEPGKQSQRRTNRLAPLGKTTMARVFPLVVKELATRAGKGNMKLSAKFRSERARMAGKASGRARLRKGLIEATGQGRVKTRVKDAKID